jgi:hypothetical protein
MRAALVALALLAPATADEPVRVAVDAPAVAPRAIPVRIAVAVDADPGALDARTAPLRIRVRLARACGATFDSTGGQTVLDAELNPQPQPATAYTSRVSPVASIRSYGTFTACAFVEQEGDDRLYAFDGTTEVSVTARCTVAASRAQRLARRLAHARRKAIRRRLRRRLAAARAAERRACPAS